MKKYIAFICVIFTFVLSCTKETNPNNSNNNNGNNNSNFTFKDTLNSLCKNAKLNCLKPFKDYYVLINSGIQPLDISRNQIRFYHDYNNYFGFEGALDSRFTFEIDANDCSTIKVRELTGGGSFIRNIKIKKFNDSILVTQDDVLCPNGDCYFLHKNLLPKYLKSNCTNISCPSCVNSYCMCGEYSSGNNCANKFLSYEKFDWDKCGDVLEIEQNKYLMYHYNWPDVHKSALSIIDENLKVVWQYDFPPNINLTNLSLNKINDTYILISDHSNLAYGYINYYLFNYKTNTLSARNNLKLNTSLNGAYDFSDVHVGTNGFFIHLRNNSSYNNVIVKCSLVNQALQLQNVKKFQTSNLTVNDNKIHTFDFLDGNTLSEHDKIVIKTYNSDFNLLSSETKAYFTNPSPDKNLSFTLTSVYKILKTNDRYFFLLGGLMDDTFRDGFQSNLVLLETDKNFNLKNYSEIAPHLSNDIYPYGINYSMYYLNNKLYLSSSNQDGNYLNMVIFSGGRYHSNSYFFEFDKKTCKPNDMFLTKSNELLILGEGVNYGNRITGVKFNEKSIYNYPICN